MLSNVRGLTVSAPANVTVVRSAPHSAVFCHASAVVCHGGHGAVMKAFAHGLPLVIMPFGRDHKITARAWKSPELESCSPRHRAARGLPTQSSEFCMKKAFAPTHGGWHE
jgi:hypothetical protein